jgi:hypothetical protein
VQKITVAFSGHGQIRNHGKHVSKDNSVGKWTMNWVYFYLSLMNNH